MVAAWNVDDGLETNERGRKQRENRKLGMGAGWDLRGPVGSPQGLETESGAIGLVWEMLANVVLFLPPTLEFLLWLQIPGLPTIYNLQNMVIPFYSRMLASMDFNSIYHIKISLSSARFPRYKIEDLLKKSCLNQY